ncbi:subtilisin-like protease SBT4.13 [Rosa chinensis]|uniref:subtilisin-like protease SBT4.13 n=1 Tax=Rosa chinensis TaxID=74649 RepID=UPI001AD94C95|nr:subtilisin-like protease SBT4.13 [Rosa chinensis]
MALRWFLLLNLICSILLLVDVTHLAAQDTRKAYVVYMGDKPKNGVPILPDLHMNMLQDVVDSSNIDIAHEALLLHSYKRSFNGFAAMLTEQEAQKMTGTYYCNQCSKNRPPRSWAAALRLKEWQIGGCGRDGAEWPPRRATRRLGGWEKRAGRLD